MLELAGFAAGVCGILFLLQSGQGLSYPVLLIDLAVAAFCIFLWWIHCFSVRVGFWFDWIFGASWLLILFLFQDTLLPGMVQLMAVFLIFVLEFRWRSHGFLYLFTTPDFLFVHTREEVEKKKGNRIKGYRQGGNAPSDNCFGFYRGGFYPGSRFCVDRRGAVFKRV